jgi:hypothetical protein
MWWQWDGALRRAAAEQPRAAAVPVRMVVEPKQVVGRQVRKVSAPRISVGIATYNRPEFFRKTAAAVAERLVATKTVDRVYVHDDGSLAKHRGQYRRGLARLPDAVVLADGVNRGVAAAKNRLLSAMLDDGAEWLFVLEDDIRVTSPEAVTGYLAACEGSGLHHLSFAHHGPANVGVAPETDGPVSFFPHAIGAWCVYSRECLERCGLMDESFSNAWEHVEHSARLAEGGYTSGAYRWADATGSEGWLRELPGSIEGSSIRPGEGHRRDIADGLVYWRQTYPVTFDSLFGDDKPLGAWAAQVMAGATVGVAA